MKHSNSSGKSILSNPDINKDDNHFNRGVELMLNGGKKKQTQPFHIIFEKIVCFFNREVTIYFEFSFKSIKKNYFPGEKQC